MNNADRPAYPVYDPQAPASDFEWAGGISKREYFAAQAMMGLLSNPHRELRWCAQEAVHQADMLLEALSQEDTAND